MKSKVSRKLIILVLILIATLPLGLQLSLSELHKMENDSLTINNIGYIRGSSQRIIKSSIKDERGYIMQSVENRFRQIEQNFIHTHSDYFEQFDFIAHYTKLIQSWHALTQALKSSAGQESLEQLTEACWQAADQTTNAAAKISKRKYDRTVLTVFSIGSLIFVILLFTLYLIYVEVRSQLETNIILDPLTKLYNRFHLLEVLQRRIHTYERQHNPFSLLFIDIDHFKQINDTYGHRKGDEVLKGFSKLLKTNLRGDDVAFRYGGEEFVILATHENAAQAYVLSERVRKLTYAHDFGLKDPVTISVGVCEFGSDESLEGLLSHADAAMYEAKSTGRNRSIIYENKELLSA